MPIGVLSSYFHLPYRHNINPCPISFEGLPLGESDDFSLFAACNGGGSYQASYIEDALFWSSYFIVNM